MRTRFLVLRGGAIGDLILTLPVLQALRSQWPDAHVELVGYPRTNELAKATGLADEVRSLDSAQAAQLYIPEVDLSLELAKWLDSFSVIIHFLSDPDNLVTENLAFYAKQVIACAPMPPPGIHATDHYLSSLHSLAIMESGLRPSLQVPGMGRTGAEDTVAIHPGSGGAHKNWPVDRYVELAADFPSVLWVLGEADDEVAAQLPADAVRARNLPLVDLAVRLSSCQQFIGNDSGVAHLAAAVGVPCTVLFGPTDPECWGPRGPATIETVRSPSEFIGDLAIGEVRAAVQRTAAGKKDS